MHRFLKLLILPLLDALAPRVIVEVGAGQGALTVQLLGWVESNGAILHAIDPDPTPAVERLAAEHGEQLHLLSAKSVDVLGEIANVELALIDGDHNWYTVLNELRALERRAGEDGRDPPVILLHEIGWPYGRRDSYRDPEAIPEAHRQPYARQGVVPGQAELGAGLNDDRDNALLEGTPANGVLSAVEDFLAGSQASWRSCSIPGLGGLQILLSGAAPESNAALGSLLDSLESPAFLRAQCEAIEAERIESERRRAGLRRRLAETQLRQVMKSPDPRQAIALKRRARELTEQVRELNEGLERVEELEEQVRLLADGQSGALRSGTSGTPR